MLPIVLLILGASVLIALTLKYKMRWSTGLILVAISILGIVISCFGLNVTTPKSGYDVLLPRSSVWFTLIFCASVCMIPFGLIGLLCPRKT